MRLRANTSASRFTGISTLFTHPFVRRANRFNFQRSIECNPSFQFTTPYFPITCLLTGSAHTLRMRHASVSQRSASGSRPNNRKKVASPLPHTSKSIHLLPSRSFLHRCPHSQGGCAFLAPKYVHISPSAILDAAIIAIRPLARHALIARIRSSAIAPLFDPTAYRCSACPHYARRRRYARALYYAHLNRLQFDMLREARPIGVRRVLPLEIAALVNLTPTCVRLWASNWIRSVGIRCRAYMPFRAP